MERNYKKLDFVINHEDFDNEVTKILREIRPHWVNQVLVTKILTDGFINHTFLIHLETDSEQSDALVVRVNGQASLAFGADRERELRTLLVLNQKNQGVMLEASFLNGIVMRRIPGEPMTDPQIRDPRMSRMIAKEMARTHAATPRVPQGPQDLLDMGDPLKIVKTTMAHMPLAYNDDSPNVERLREKLPCAAITKEAESLIQSLADQDLAIALCHNDLWSANILYDKRTDRVKFIDWELGGYTYTAFDIADHFVWLAGVPASAEFIPEVTFKKRFLRDYLEELGVAAAEEAGGGARPGPVTDAQVDALYTQTCLCEQLAQLFICMMMIGMNHDESINSQFMSYDYLTHAEFCWGQFHSLRRELN